LRVQGGASAADFASLTRSAALVGTRAIDGHEVVFAACAALEKDKAERTIAAADTPNRPIPELP
jgi:hypothetical protein